MTQFKEMTSEELRDRLDSLVSDMDSGKKIGICLRSYPDRIFPLLICGGKVCFQTDFLIDGTTPYQFENRFSYPLYFNQNRPSDNIIRIDEITE